MNRDSEPKPAKRQEHALAKIESNQCSISRKYTVYCRCGWQTVTQTRPNARRRLKDHKELARRQP